MMTTLRNAKEVVSEKAVFEGIKVPKTDPDMVEIATMLIDKKVGKFDPSKEPKDHREFYGKGVVITSENAQSFYDTNIKAEPTLDWNDIWGRVTGQIQYN